MLSFVCPKIRSTLLASALLVFFFANLATETEAIWNKINQTWDYEIAQPILPSTEHIGRGFKDEVKDAFKGLEGVVEKELGKVGNSFESAAYWVENHADKVTDFLKKIPTILLHIVVHDPKAIFTNIMKSQGLEYVKRLLSKIGAGEAAVLDDIVTAVRRLKNEVKKILEDATANEVSCLLLQRRKQLIKSVEERFNEEFAARLEHAEPNVVMAVIEEAMKALKNNTHHLQSMEILRVSVSVEVEKFSIVGLLNEIKLILFEEIAHSTANIVTRVVRKFVLNFKITDLKTFDPKEAFTDELSQYLVETLKQTFRNIKDAFVDIFRSRMKDAAKRTAKSMLFKIKEANDSIPFGSALLTPPVGNGELLTDAINKVSERLVGNGPPIIVSTISSSGSSPDWSDDKKGVCYAQSSVLLASTKELSLEGQQKRRLQCKCGLVGKYVKTCDTGCRKCATNTKTKAKSCIRAISVDLECNKKLMVCCDDTN